MGDFVIVKSGDLSMQVKGMFKSSWHNKFCVLYGRSTDSHPCLETYESRKSFDDIKTSGKKCDKKLVLHNVRGISTGRHMENTGSTQQYYIEIKFKRDKQLLLFNSEHDSNDWYVKLNGNIDTADKADDHSSSSVRSTDRHNGDDDTWMTENLVYEGSDGISSPVYDVTVQDTDLARLCQIQGKFRLHIHPASLAFEHPNTRHIQQTVPFQCIRRYGEEKQVISITCGRKFVNGVGKLLIKSENIKDVIQTLVSNMESCSRQGGVAPASEVQPHSISPQVAIKHERRASASSRERIDSDSGSKHSPVQPPDSPVVHFPMSSAANMLKRHPGQSGPALVPLPNKPQHANTDDSDNMVGKHGHVVRHSTKETETKDNDQTEEFKRSRSVGGSVHKASAFAKELESTLKVLPPGDEGSIKSETKERELSEKEKKKLHKEEERRKKKENEELEKKRKEEQKANAKLNKKREKDLKDREKASIRRSKGGKAIEPPAVGPSVYEEVDTDISVLPASANRPKDEEFLYDEATPVKGGTLLAEPVEYAQPFNNTGRHNRPSNMNEYAEPYASSKTVSGMAEPVMYSDVEDVRSHGWKKHGRKEEEEIHEEDYSNIKSARQSLTASSQPPPIPLKNYSSDEAIDDTYNILDYKPDRTPQQNNDGNIYGMASGTSVGPIPPIRSKSQEGSSGSGEPYTASEDDNEYDNCQSTGNVQPASAATVPSPKRAPQPPTEDLYEQLS